MFGFMIILSKTLVLSYEKHVTGDDRKIGDLFAVSLVWFMFVFIGW